MATAPIVNTQLGPLEAVPVWEVGTDGATSLGYMQIPLSTTVATVLDNAPDGATMVVMKVEGGGMRYRDDGVSPTATVGMPLASGEAVTYDATLNQLSLIAQDDGAICNITFYGES